MTILVYSVDDVTQLPVNLLLFDMPVIAYAYEVIVTVIIEIANKFVCITVTGHTGVFFHNAIYSIIHRIKINSYVNTYFWFFS